MKRVGWLGCLAVPVLFLFACGGGLASPIGSDFDDGAGSSSGGSSSGGGGGCLLDGKKVPVGTKWQAECNTCWCESSSQGPSVMCTAAFCGGGGNGGTEPVPPEPEPPITDGGPPAKDGGPQLPDPDAGATRLRVDGVGCTIDSESVLPHTAPDGKTWTLDVKATCPSGPVDISAVSRETPPYPHLCTTSPSNWTIIQMIGPTVAPDGGRRWFDSSSGGSCNVSQGPTVANGNIPVAFSAVVRGFLNETHTLSYAGL